MKRSIEQVEKQLKSYLSMETVHEGNKLKSVVNETISTYDGTYPLFNITYQRIEGGLIPDIKRNLIVNIEKYLGLKHRSDYWLGITIEK